MMTLVGQKELERFLNKLPDDLQKDVETEGLERISTGIMDTARRLVRKRTGRLARSITRSRSPGEVKIGVGKGGKHWHLIEFGTAPHGNHPGTPAFPFFGPAFNKWLRLGDSVIAAIIRRRLKK